MVVRLTRRDRRAVRANRINDSYRIQASWPRRILYALIGRQH